jgi:hypothetical protein
MKTVLFLIFTGLLFSPLSGQSPIQFYLETDADIYEYEQDIQITYFLYNPNPESVYIELQCSNPFSYSIDEVWFHSGCFCMISPISIQPYSSFTTSDTHIETLSVGSHYIYGKLSHYGNYLYTPNVYIDVVQANSDALELNSTDFSLSNFPNPFNPTTTIEFNIEPSQQNEQIELEIYNLKGQKIKTIANDEFPKGTHSFIWNGDDATGKPVSSGIYLYKLKIDGKTEAMRKCLLLK